MSVKINRNLKLVLPMEQDDGSPLYVHSTPIAKETFDRYFLVLSKAFSAIYSEGLHALAGPRVAAKIIRKVAESQGDWEYDGENSALSVKMGLMEEIKRLTLVFVPTNAGWQYIPLDTAVKQGILDEENEDEVMNIVCFFTVNSVMHSKQVLPVILKELSGLWNAEITSSTATEYMNSLPMWTPPANSGETAAPSSIPS